MNLLMDLFEIWLCVFAASVVVTALMMFVYWLTVRERDAALEAAWQAQKRRSSVAQG